MRWPARLFVWLLKAFVSSFIYFQMFLISTFRLLLIEEITGITNLTMSYASFAKKIVVPYKVNITGWPEDVPRSYPQRLAADQTKSLYDAWSTGAAHWYRMTAAEARSYQNKAEKNGELEPTVRKKRSDAGTKRRQDNSTGDDSDEDENPRPAKGSRRKRAAENDANEGSDPDIRPKKKSKHVAKTGSKKSGRGVGAGEKLGGGGGGKKSGRANAKAGRKAAGSSKKSVDGGKKSTAGKGKKKSRRFIVSDSDEDSGDDGAGDVDDDEDDAEFST